MLETVKGDFSGDYSVARRGFTYWYVCERCRDCFLETAPEISKPCLCHGCHSGENLRKHERFKRKNRNGRRET